MKNTANCYSIYFARQPANSILQNKQKNDCTRQLLPKFQNVLCNMQMLDANAGSLIQFESNLSKYTLSQSINQSIGQSIGPILSLALSHPCFFLLLFSRRLLLFVSLCVVKSVREREGERGGGMFARARARARRGREIR